LQTRNSGPLAGQDVRHTFSLSIRLRSTADGPTRYREVVLML
jgi:hypothetical protein